MNCWLSNVSVGLNMPVIPSIRVQFPVAGTIMLSPVLISSCSKILLENDQVLVFLGGLATDALFLFS